MARCPNCSYELILLKSRPKCKCARCGMLFPQREAENREFRIWNKKQREMDEHNLQLETKQYKKKSTAIKKKHKLTTEEKRERMLKLKRLWRKDNKKNLKHG